jgi:hypothetical protein
MGNRLDSRWHWLDGEDFSTSGFTCASRSGRKSFSAFPSSQLYLLSGSRTHTHTLRSSANTGTWENSSRSSHSRARLFKQRKIFSRWEFSSAAFRRGKISLPDVKGPRQCVTIPRQSLSHGRLINSLPDATRVQFHALSALFFLASMGGKKLFSFSPRTHLVKKFSPRLFSSPPFVVMILGDFLLLFDVNWTLDSKFLPNFLNTLLYDFFLFIIFLYLI